MNTYTSHSSEDHRTIERAEIVEVVDLTDAEEAGRVYRPPEQVVVLVTLTDDRPRTGSPDAIRQVQ